MYISKLHLDKRKRDTAAALWDRGVLHSAIEGCAEGDRPHNLWRLEPDNGVLLIVSRDIPYLGDLQNRFGNSKMSPKTLEYGRYIDTVKNGNVLRFMIEVNPVINSKKGCGGNGKDIPLNIVRTKNQPFSAKDWMIQKLKENGASVINVKDIHHDTVGIVKKDMRIPLFTVTYSGIIRVEDEDAVKNAMRKGIGGKKTYGCGLLTVAGIR